jgi:hypothetical protein
MFVTIQVTLVNIDGIYCRMDVIIFIKINKICFLINFMKNTNKRLSTLVHMY